MGNHLPGHRAALTIANLTLPPEDVMFQVGDINMPWLPPVVLAFAGIILLAGVNEPEVQKPAVTIDPEKAALNKGLETIAWGAFLVMLGGFMFVPDEIVRGGWWSIGVGLILLGLNVARYCKGLRMSGFTTFLGVISIGGGLLNLFGVEGMNGALLLIVLGGYLIFKGFIEKRQLFGRAEKL